MCIYLSWDKMKNAESGSGQTLHHWRVWWFTSLGGNSKWLQHSAGWGIFTARSDNYRAAASDTRPYYCIQQCKACKHMCRSTLDIQDSVFTLPRPHAVISMRQLVLLVSKWWNEKMNEVEVSRLCDEQLLYLLTFISLLLLSSNIIGQTTDCVSVKWQFKG